MIMSGASHHTSGSRTLTAALGAILLLAEIPIHLMEHTHFLHAVETHFPQFYALLISQTVTFARWIVGSLLVLWVIVESRRQGARLRATEQPVTPPQAVAPQQQINFNPVIQNIQHAPHVGGAAELAQPAPRPQPQAAPAPPRPNLIFVHTRIVRVTFDNDPNRQFFYESQIDDRNDPRAVIACFRNEPVAGMAVINVECVRAQVVYRNQAGAEVGIGNPRTCWLDEFGDMVDFDVGDSQCAILIISRPEGELQVPRQRRGRANDGMGDTLNLQIQPLNEAITTIEIRLLDDQHGLLATNVFDFANEDGQIRIEPQAARA